MKQWASSALIGYYNPSVILTYIGLASSVWGIFLAVEGFILSALLCLLVSGVCDMFDGRIARRIPRSDDEKSFGIQIDSLCDLICFGVFPAVIAWSLGVRGFLGAVILALYILTAVIRLGYFNVSEAKRQSETAEPRHFYQGLPVTSAAVLLPLIYLLPHLLADQTRAVFLAEPVADTIAVTGTVILFTLQFRKALRKLENGRLQDVKPHA